MQDPTQVPSEQESDKFSEGGSDSEPSDEDYGCGFLKLLYQSIKKDILAKNQDAEEGDGHK